MKALFGFRCYASRFLGVLMFIALAIAIRPLASGAEIEQTQSIASYSQTQLEELVNNFKSNSSNPIQFNFPTEDGVVKALLYPKRRLIKRHSQGKEDVFPFAGRIVRGTKQDFLALTVGYREDGSLWASGFAQIKGKYHSLEPLEATARSRGRGLQSRPALELSINRISKEQLGRVLAACGAKTRAHALLPESLSTAKVARVALREIEIATEADYSYFQLYGSAAAAKARIATILNGVDQLYRQQLGLTLRITFQNVRTTPDPYLGSSVDERVLESFANTWDAQFRSVQRDIAHIWTNRDFGNTAGIAYIGSVCTDAGYGLSTTFNSTGLQVLLAAHEIGHNMGAEHDEQLPQTIMYPSLYVTDSPQFSQTTRNEIGRLVTARSACLRDVSTIPPPGPPPPTGQLGCEVIVSKSSVVSGETVRVSWLNTSTGGAQASKRTIRYPMRRAVPQGNAVPRLGSVSNCSSTSGCLIGDYTVVGRPRTIFRLVLEDSSGRTRTCETSIRVEPNPASCKIRGPRSVRVNQQINVTWNNSWAREVRSLGWTGVPVYYRRADGSEGSGLGPTGVPGCGYGTNPITDRAPGDRCLFGGLYFKQPGTASVALEVTYGDPARTIKNTCVYKVQVRP